MSTFLIDWLVGKTHTHKIPHSSTECERNYCRKIVPAIMCSFEDVKAAADFIKSKCSLQPKLGVICGSRLGGLAESVTDPLVIPYSEIVHFPQSTLRGHAGQLVLGKLAGKSVVYMQGRCHPFEGYSMNQVRNLRLQHLSTVSARFTNSSDEITRSGDDHFDECCRSA